jgi:hypothetical protein
MLNLAALWRGREHLIAFSLKLLLDVEAGKLATLWEAKYMYISHVAIVCEARTSKLEVIGIFRHHGYSQPR